MRDSKLEPRFVEFIPDLLDQGTIYISMGYATASHKCCCGCGEEVVTPFSPTDWKLTFDGVDVSLWPSIGNWSSPCRSHYVVRNGRVIEAPAWSESEVAAERLRDGRAKAAYFEIEAKGRGVDDTVTPLPRQNPLSKFIRWCRGF